MELKTVSGTVIFALESAKAVIELVAAAATARKSLSDAVLSGAVLSDAVLRGAVLRGNKIRAMRVFSGLYDYEIWAVLFEDGTRMVRMGCLYKTLEEWEAVTVRKSNIGEFPDDGSERSEERALAFEFAKATALKLK